METPDVIIVSVTITHVSISSTHQEFDTRVQKTMKLHFCMLSLKHANTVFFLYHGLLKLYFFFKPAPLEKVKQEWPLVEVMTPTTSCQAGVAQDLWKPAGGKWPVFRVSGFGKCMPKI